MLIVNSVRYVGSYKLQINLSNGTTGLFDVSNYITKGAFKELSNETYLKLVEVDDSSMGICWPNGQDFSSDTLECELDIINNNIWDSLFKAEESASDDFMIEREYTVKDLLKTTCKD